MAYITELRETWNGHTEHDSSRGAHLALEVVKVFWGDLCTGYRGTEKEGEDPVWLKLKWGVAIASRALDAWTAASNGFEVDMVRHQRRDCSTCPFSGKFVRAVSFCFTQRDTPSY